MVLTLPLFKRFPHLVKFKPGSNTPGVIAAMTGTGTGVILYLPALPIGGATGATGVATAQQAMSLFEYISIDPTQVDDYGGTITITESGITVT